ncbi:DUF5040 domain-containing protein [Dysgonomonas sp. 520]|uniref:DUF5040 domain-containing protein n=1 Tax=Dysgonomonas sp. 520 TaxID=2302931 RepID=UPI0013D61C7F|nr:DUF5040 domain-containing protein [Dysgonomonas sp. 520]NDW08711.1 DUF5040 domain-containing protein [Dysgonomonas sp. 520]
MKKYSLLFVCLTIVSFTLFAQKEETLPEKGFNILLTGASFATSSNGWFEFGCEQLNANPINRAIGGEAIASTANRMIKGTLYSKEELEVIDALVIMQVHERDVYDPTQLKANYNDYETPFDRINYAAAYDYVIKRYMTECYELKNDSTSKYFGTQSGKPVVIVFCTHWHDGRTVYNQTIRQLAEKWGFPLIEFDKFIGFSKEKRHPVTNQQISLLYAQDTQKIDGEVFGWHPMKGQNQYIQQRMGCIFADLMRKILPIGRN